MYVMHGYRTPDGTPLRLQLDDHWFTLPTNEPVEIHTDDYGKIVSDSDFYGQKLIEQYGANYGIIEIPTQKTRTGTHIDIDKAEDRARRQLAAVEENMVISWARVQLEERVKEGKPVMPPVGRVEQIIRERNIDLKARFGLVPVGFDYTPTGASTAEAAAELAALRAENAQLRAQSVKSSDTVDALAELLGVDPTELAAKVQEKAAIQATSPSTKSKQK